MKKITFPKEVEEETISINEVSENRPIFAKRDGKFTGMIVNESDHGWILRLGGSAGANGHHDSARKCMETCLKYRHEFYVE